MIFKVTNCLAVILGLIKIATTLPIGLNSFEIRFIELILVSLEVSSILNVLRLFI